MSKLLHKKNCRSISIFRDIEICFIHFSKIMHLLSTYHVCDSKNVVIFWNFLIIKIIPPRLVVWPRCCRRMLLGPCRRSTRTSYWMAYFYLLPNRSSPSMQKNCICRLCYFFIHGTQMRRFWCLAHFFLPVRKILWSDGQMLDWNGWDGVVLLFF